MSLFRLLLVTLFILSSAAEAVRCPSLDTWLKNNPKVAAAIVLEEKAKITGWTDWSEQNKKELRTNYQIACDSQDKISSKNSIFGFELPIPNQKVLKDNDNGNTVYSPTAARKIYFAHVSHSLILETTRKIGWSFLGDSTNALFTLFDSRQFFDWNEGESGYMLNEERNGLISYSPPDIVYSFLKTEKVIGKTRRETVLNWIRWTTNLTHDFSTKKSVHYGYKRESAYFLEAFWQYRGFPPALSVLEGTNQTLTTDKMVDKRHWTAGCWGTTGLYKAVLRAVNIPIELRHVGGHAMPFFQTENTFLTHADDPYNSLFNTLPNPLPVGELLFPQDEWKALFGADGSQEKRVGYGPVKIAIDRIPKVMFKDYCDDLAKNLAPEKSSVYKLCKKQFSLETLRKKHLWERLNRLKNKVPCP